MDVPPLDEAALTEAYGLLGHRHGKLDGLAIWLSGVQGRVPPRPLARRRVVVFGASEVAGDVTETGTAWEDGVALADREVDAGADVFVVVRAADPDAAALAAALTGAEPVDVVASGARWAADVGAVRDALRAHRGATPRELADALGLAAVAGFLAQAARRRTPALLDGTAAAAAALVATRTAPDAVAYLVAAHVTPDPAHRLALRSLGLEPLLDLGIAADGGALLALPLLDAAVALLDQRG